MLRLISERNIHFWKAYMHRRLRRIMFFTWSCTLKKSKSGGFFLISPGPHRHHLFAFCRSSSVIGVYGQTLNQLFLVVRLAMV